MQSTIPETATCWLHCAIARVNHVSQEPDCHETDLELLQACLTDGFRSDAGNVVARTGMPCSSSALPRYPECPVPRHQAQLNLAATSVKRPKQCSGWLAMTGVHYGMSSMLGPGSFAMSQLCLHKQVSKLCKQVQGPETSNSVLGHSLRA